jgi:sugar phosphate isomerase/epimerase
MSTMQRQIGIMQGRLLPKYFGRYQAHPLGYWQKEFDLAKELGLYCVEFILDYNDAEQNPLLKEDGVERILEKVNESGVKVKSICADYFMEAPLHHRDESVIKLGQSILNRLITNGKKIGITDIVIPCVDHSSLKTEDDVRRFADALDPVIGHAELNDINLSLETDLNPEAFGRLLEKFPSKKITVNYDTGNSASLGFDPVEEFNCYGSRISDIHIKDRKFGGGSVILGTGDTNFENFFQAIKKINFNGPFIMQVYRDDEGISVFKQQLDWFTNKYLS